MEKEQQELIFKLSMFEQQMKQIQQQLESVEQGIVDLMSLNAGLDELTDSKNKEILAPVGRGIFAKAKLTSEELIVDIGGKTLIKKNIPETQELISEQIKKLEEVKISLMNSMESMNQEITQIIMNAQGKG